MPKKTNAQLLAEIEELQKENGLLKNKLDEVIKKNNGLKKISSKVLTSADIIVKG